jgi:hypothetical protein
LLASWEEAGFSRDEFWRSTPRQIFATLRARSLVLIREHNERAWLAWHIVKLGRAKNVPGLKTLQAKRPGRVQPWQEQMRIMDQWVRATRHFPQSKTNAVN